MIPSTVKVQNMPSSSGEKVSALAMVFEGGTRGLLHDRWRVSYGVIERVWDEIVLLIVWLYKCNESKLHTLKWQRWRQSLFPATPRCVWSRQRWWHPSPFHTAVSIYSHSSQRKTCHGDSRQMVIFQLPCFSCVYSVVSFWKEGLPLLSCLLSIQYINAANTLVLHNCIMWWRINIKSWIFHNSHLFYAQIILNLTKKSWFVLTPVPLISPVTRQALPYLLTPRCPTPQCIPGLSSVVTQVFQVEIPFTRNWYLETKVSPCCSSSWKIKNARVSALQNFEISH